MNNGTIKGTKAYGILGGDLSYANNVISMASVIGTKESYSFWTKTMNSATSLYCLNGTCVNCDKIAAPFIMDNDGKYHTLNGDLVSALLNEEAEKKGYELRWDSNLMLRTPTINVHIGNPVNQYVKVLNGTALEDSGIPSIYHYFIEGTEPSVSNEFNKTMTIDDDIDLAPYYLLTVTGEVSTLSLYKPMVSTV